MKLEDFNYFLPEALIAQSAYKKRDEAKLMILDRNKKKIEHKIFKDILEYFNKGDVLVLNNTKVIPARIFGTKSTGAKVEILLLKDLVKNNWEAIVRPGNKLKKGALVEVSNELNIEIIEVLENGNRIVNLQYNGILNEILEKVGAMPLPPYITKKLEDNNDYQTVYAKHDGSAACPTAGLHFTEELLEKLQQKGVEIANVTLHVGLGTFRPVKDGDIEKHNMHSEHFYITKENADIINKAKKENRRIIACGTTSCRVLETVADENGFVKEIEDDTQIFIYPGYKFKCIDGLITNFHLPKSTLLMLISAFYDREEILKAYNEAVKNKYLFFSFGDAMFIL